MPARSYTLEPEIIAFARAFLKEPGMSERLSVRRRSEDAAGDLLQRRLGILTKDEIVRFQFLLNMDYEDGKEKNTRFGMAFGGANRERSAARPEAFNSWSKRLWECTEDDIAATLDDFWTKKEIEGAGTPLPTAVLYLRDPKRWGIWIPAIENQLASLLTGYEKGARKTAEGYIHFNTAYLAVMRQLEVPPSLMDLAVWVSHRSVRHTWDTVKSHEQLQERIKYWSDGFLHGEPIAVDKASQSTHWYYSPDYNTFGPSKFIGYEGLTFENYTSSNIAGTVTQKAIRQLGTYRKLRSDSESHAMKPLLEELLARQNRPLKKNAVIHVPKALDLSSISAAGRVENEGASSVPQSDPNISATPYNISGIIDDGCFIPEDELRTYLEQLTRKKNLILQGPPGTGKTWLAKRLGYALMGEKAHANLQSVQFHPNLSYEDFIRGYRPTPNANLSCEDGNFMKMIKEALRAPDKTFVMVIEEINRGNPVQIFGEMLTLLEADKRTPEEALKLSYGDDRIYVPENLYVIGTMNIADRSLALVDLALRRRFAFIDLIPRLGDEWKKWVVSRGVTADAAGQIQRRMNALNQTIAGDAGLGAQFQVGHSYVTPRAEQFIEDSRDWFFQVVDAEIAPLLDEYWFDNRPKAKDEKNRLKDGF